MIVGMIGLGRTGLPIAANLVARGHEVLGYRRSDAAAFVAAGGKLARSPKQITEATQVVLSCLPSVDALDDAMGRADGIVAGAGPGHVIVELGSFPLAVKERWRQALLAKGAVFIDGEISGTPAMTASRTAVFLLAGDREACERVMVVCRDATEHARYAGPFGAATHLKLVANVLVAVHTAAAAEAVLLAERAGLDTALAIDVLRLGAGSSTMFQFRAPSMAARKFVDPAPGPVSMLAHYLDPIAELAAEAGVATPLFDVSSDLFKRALADGRGAEDIACVIELIEKRSRP